MTWLGFAVFFLGIWVIAAPTTFWVMTRYGISDAIETLQVAPPAERESDESCEARPATPWRPQIGRWLVLAACFFALSGVIQLVFHQGARLVAVSFGLAGLCLANVVLFRWISGR